MCVCVCVCVCVSKNTDIDILYFLPCLYIIKLVDIRFRHTD